MGLANVTDLLLVPVRLMSLSIAADNACKHTSNCLLEQQSLLEQLHWQHPGEARETMQKKHIAGSQEGVTLTTTDTRHRSQPGC